MGEKIPVKIWDFIIITLALCLIGFSAFSVYAGVQDAGQVLVQGRGGQWVFPLDAEETLAVPGPLGDTVVKIHHRRAWVESSPCENQICVAAGHIQRRGIWLACLPNNVFLMIHGNGIDGDEVDAIAW